MVVLHQGLFLVICKNALRNLGWNSEPKYLKPCKEKKRKYFIEELEDSTIILVKKKKRAFHEDYREYNSSRKNRIEKKSPKVVVEVN